MSSIDETLKERGSRYGEFPEHARITQGLKECMADTPRWVMLADDQMEALEMVAHKIGRILNGDPNYIDSWTDIIGYVRLVEKRLIDEQATARSMMAGDSTQATTFGAIASPVVEPSKCADPLCPACYPAAAGQQSLNFVSLRQAAQEFDNQQASARVAALARKEFTFGELIAMAERHQRR